MVEILYLKKYQENKGIVDNNVFISNNDYINESPMNHSKGERNVCMCVSTRKYRR